MAEPQDPLDGFARDWDELSDRVDAARARAAAAPTLKWATVTQLNPVRIRIDGDETELAGAPAKTVTNLRAGDRVFVALQGTRITVITRAGGDAASRHIYENDTNKRLYFGGIAGSDNVFDSAGLYLGMDPLATGSQNALWLRDQRNNTELFGVRADGSWRFGQDTSWATLPLSSGITVYSSQTPQWRVRRGRLLLRGAVALSSGNFTTSYTTVCPTGAIPALPGMRNSWTTVRVVPSAGAQPAGRMYQGGGGELYIATTSGTAPYYLLNSTYDLED